MPAVKPILNRYLAISVAIVLGALAINGGRIVDALERLFAPTPANLIIVAPATSDIV